MMSVRAVKLGGTSKFVKKKPTQMSLIYKRVWMMIIVMNAMMNSQVLILEKRCGVRKMSMKKMTYGSHYSEEYAGSYAQQEMGYDDDAINDAFEGDPDNYWNID